MKKQKTDSIRNRVFSFMSAIIFGLNSIPMMTYTTANAASSASSSGSVMFPKNDADKSAKLNHDDTLVDNGDGTFTYTSKIFASYSYLDTSKGRLQTTDNYYEFKKKGKYLIELWGGDGGRAFLSGRNGIGGKGGFVYGILDVDDSMLNKRLYYEIGSKGESKTYDVSGGGSAGDGGGAGNIALVSIGAGGGYSAVYLLNKDETITTDPQLAPDTLDPNNIRDNAEKVLMIAGGGGGGASGANGFHLTALILKMHGDGGDGGSEQSSISATPNIGNFTTGTYYAGDDGTSSGGKASYVGQGGTDKPEGLAKTAIGFMTASTYANDWQRTYHHELRRGVGGAGNLHGGGGGAGFAGGGGGIQNVILDANNVGGGGGGSSYLAEHTEENNFYPLNTLSGYNNITSSEYFVNKKDNTNADIGGAIVIRYLEEENYYNYLNDVTISSKVSDYFVIDKVKSSCYCSTDPDNNCLTVADNNGISFSGSLEPQGKGITMGQPKNTLTLTLRLKPKTDFAGGNDVPIFDTGEFSCVSNITGQTDKNCTYSYSNTYETEEKKDSYKVSHVNVPFNYKVEANSFTSNKGDVYGAGNIIGTCDTVNNKFTDPISDPYVTYSGQPFNAYDSHYNAAKTYKYDVNIDVKPTTDGANSVGDANNDPTTLKAQSVVQVIDGLPLDGFVVKPKKSLTYDKTGGTYDFTVDLDIQSKNELNKSFYVYDPLASKELSKLISTTNHNIARNNSGNNDAYQDATITVPLPKGYYFIEVWGADGGNAGLDGGIYSPESGVGGAGGYKSGYIYISKDNVSASVEVGLRGWNGATFSVTPNDNNRAYGGGYSKITIENNYIIAGGGGGGSVSGASPQANGFAADTPNHTADTNNGGTSITHYSLSLFGDRTRTPGDGGKSERSGFVDWNDLPSIAKTHLIECNVSSKPTGGATGNGAVKITKLGAYGGHSYGSGATNISDTSNTLNTVVNQIKNDYATDLARYFDLNCDFSKYFALETDSNYSITNHAEEEKQTGYYTFHLSDSDVKSVETPQDTTYTINELQGYTFTKHNYKYGIKGDKSVTFKLKSKDLVGGNDIPLLDKVINEDTPGITAVKLSHSDTTTESDDVIYVDANPSTDYANVKIDEEAFDLKDVPEEVIVDYGEAATINADIEYASGKNHEFVDESVSVAPSELTKDGKYTVVGTVKPKDDAEKAVEIPSVEPKYKSGQVNVRIKYTVNKVLTNLHQASVEYLDNGKTTVMPNGGNVSLANEKDSFTVDDIHDAYVFTIEPDANYDLPADTAVTVTYGDGEAVMAADIKKKDGKMIITIPSSAFTNNITISVSGIENRTPHYVHFLYSVYDEIGGFQTYEEVLTENGVKKPFYSGAELDGITFPFAPSEYPEGYDDYVWEWSVEPIGGKYLMGDKDVYIMGNYVPTTYTLIINYVAADPTNPDYADFVAPSQYTSPRQSTFDEATGVSDIAITKGAEFSIKSPEVAGYVPDKLYYSGTADDTFLSNFDANKQFTATVKYTKDESTLKIYLIKCDDYGIPNDNGTLGTSADATWDGYDRFKITQWDTEEKCEVEVDSIGDSGTYYAYYKPHHEQIPISFNKVDPSVTDKPDSEKVTLPNNSMTYVYEGMDFSYFDTQNDKYVSLPKPVCSENWLFDGWYTADGQLITDDTTVKSEYVDSENKIELYAHWLKDEFTISVDYRYACNATPSDKAGKLMDDRLGDASQVESGPLRANMSYSFTSPNVDGYDLVNEEQKIIKGYATKDEHFNVYYLNQNSAPTQTFTLTVNVYSETYRDGSTDNPVSSARKLQGGTFALYQNGTKVDGSERYNENGTITWSNAETAITADVVYTVECIDPPMGYGTASVNISSNEDEKNIFLDRAPIILPMAGSKPMTGYTVFGISAMLLAGLLMFAYVSSRTEENNEKE